MNISTTPARCKSPAALKQESQELFLFFDAIERIIYKAPASFKPYLKRLQSNLGREITRCNQRVLFLKKGGVL